jgi:hypothetical protein
MFAWMRRISTAVVGFVLIALALGNPHFSLMRILAFAAVVVSLTAVNLVPVFFPSTRPDKP